MSTRKGSKGFLFGALAGGVLGSIAALLFAPKAGKELRQDISAQAQKMGDRTGEIAKDIGNSAIQLADRTKHAASNVVVNVRNFGRGRGAKVATISGIAAEAADELATDVAQRTTGATDRLEDATEELYGNAEEAVESAADITGETAKHAVQSTEEAIAEAGDDESIREH